MADVRKVGMAGSLICLLLETSCWWLDQELYGLGCFDVALSSSHISKGGELVDWWLLPESELGCGELGWSFGLVLEGAVALGGG